MVSKVALNSKSVRRHHRVRQPTGYIMAYESVFFQLVKVIECWQRVTAPYTVPIIRAPMVEGKTAVGQLNHKLTQTALKQYG